MSCRIRIKRPNWDDITAAAPFYLFIKFVKVRNYEDSTKYIGYGTFRKICLKHGQTIFKDLVPNPKI